MAHTESSQKDVKKKERGGKNIVRKSRALWQLENGNGWGQSKATAKYAQ